MAHDLDAKWRKDMGMKGLINECDADISPYIQGEFIVWMPRLDSKVQQCRTIQKKKKKKKNSMKALRPGKVLTTGIFYTLASTSKKPTT